ncbi:unnamed protein product, partial [Ixodes hexagonus]
GREGGVVNGNICGRGNRGGGGGGGARKGERVPMGNLVPVSQAATSAHHY